MKITSRDIKIFIHKFFRKKECGFDHIISLGYNCEVTFRFLKYFNFEESNLFNWASSRSINKLIYALENFNCIGQNGFNFPNPLWECRKTQICFHGKEDTRLYIAKKDTPEIRKKDYAELKSRIEHLKEKFIKLSRSNDSKLYIYKLRKLDIDSQVEKKLIRLYNALKKYIRAQNFQLLIVYERGTVKLKENPLYILRNVDYFAPDSSVTDKKYFNNGWDKIYSEFYPKKIFRKKFKKYKFDH